MTSITHILCPVDFSDFSARAVGHALSMAKWYEARLTLLHVFVNTGAMDLPPIVLDEPEREQLRADLRRLVAPDAANGVKLVDERSGSKQSL